MDLGGGKTELRTEGSSKAHPPREANEEPEPVRSMVENHQLGLPRRHGLFHSLHGREYLRQPGVHTNAIRLPTVICARSHTNS